MAVLIETENTNVEVGKDVEISFKESFPYQSEMNVFVNGVQKTNGISYNMYDSGTAKYMVYSFTISFSESGTYDVYVTYDNRIFGLQYSNTLTFTVKDKTNIILNHKEVQSIQLTNEGIIYQRPIFKQIGSFTVSSSKDIISFVDNESTTITATVLDNNDNPISNEFILFEVDSGEYIDTFTDENGEASIIYEAKGWGDIKITVFCRNLTEIYELEDCWAYHTTVLDSDSHFTNYTWGRNWYYLSDYEVPTGFKVMMRFNKNITDCQLGLGDGNGNYFAIQPNNGKIQVYAQTDTITNVNFPTSANEIIYELVDSQTAKLYIDDTLIGTYTPKSTINRYIKVLIYYGNVYDMHYIRIKPLQSISVDVDNPILSFVDSTQANPQTATLTATVSPVVQGRNVKIYKDNTLVATEQTDENGQVSYTYTSQGVGDVGFRFECGLLTKTFTVQDISKYNQSEISFNGSHSGDTLTRLFDSYSFTSNHFEFEFDLKQNQYGGGFGVAPVGTTAPPYHHITVGSSLGNGKNRLCTYIGKQTSGETKVDYGELSANTYYHFKFIYDNGTIYFYINGTLQNTISSVSYLNGHTWQCNWYDWNSSVTITLKELKIKLL